jgi:hypothetical protein
MARVYFSQEEAQTLVGRHIENRRAFSGVPARDRGHRAAGSLDLAGLHGCHRMAARRAWQAAPRLVSRDEYRRYLKEI